MEGLEITIYRYKEIFEDNEEFRIDSEYYRKEYLSLFEKINESPNLVDLVYMSDLSTNGSFKTVSDIIHDGNDKVIPFIRSGNTGSLFIKKSELEFISKEAHSKLPKSTTSLHDVIMARKGKIGGASIVTEDEVDFNCNENVIKLTINEPEKINPWYFAIYFNSKYGIKQIERLATGNVQPWVPIFQIRKLKTHITSDNFQKVIADIGQTAHFHIKTSKERYEQAENLLLETLGLADFQPSQEPVNVKSFSESLGTSGRLDAEYYQIKYDEIISRIKTNNYSTLSEKIIRIDTGEYSPEYFSKGEKEGLSFYIRSTNLKDGLIEFDDSYYVPKKDFVRISKAGDILTARVGSVGVFSEVRKELEGSVYSDNILCFRLPESFIPSVYTLLFNSEYYYELIDRLARGSVQQRLNQETLKDLLIPVIDFDKQREIADLVEESFKLKKQSEHLLEVAKKAVEMAIEQDEETAIAFINSDR